MPEASEPVLQPRDLGQLLDQSFRVFARAWKPLLLIGLLAAIPALLMGIIQFFILGSDPEILMSDWAVEILIDLENGSWNSILTLLGLGTLMGLVYTFLMPLCTGALIDVVAREALKMPSVPVSESFRVAASRYWRLLGTNVLKWLVFLVGVVVLGIAGVFVLAFLTIPLGLIALSILFLFSSQVVVIEGVGGGIPALTRSFKLAWSRFWPLLGFAVVFFLMVYVIQMIVFFPVTFGTGIVAGLTGNFGLISVTYILQGLMQAVVVPFITVGVTLAYFDVRVRREGYDLEVQARQQQADPV